MPDRYTRANNVAIEEGHTKASYLLSMSQANALIQIANSEAAGILICVS
jgi:hypothetical protein